jgi:hypothetical protein
MFALTWGIRAASIPDLLKTNVQGRERIDALARCRTSGAL